MQRNFSSRKSVCICRQLESENTSGVQIYSCDSHTEVYHTDPHTKVYSKSQYHRIVNLPAEDEDEDDAGAHDGDRFLVSALA